MQGSAAEQAIQFLLSRNYLLTALELVQESNEAGLGHEVESLIKVFKDPTLFPPEEVAACNPEGATNLVAVAHERQQQLSALQWELAVAKEDLAALRQQAAAVVGDSQQDTACGAQQSMAGSTGPGGSATGSTGDELTAAQLGALNCAVLAHLHAQGFKLAALSLSKEAQLPPAAAVGSSAGSLAGWYIAAGRLEAQSGRLQELEKQAEQQGQQLAGQQQELEESRRKEEAAVAELEFLRTKMHNLEQQLAQQQQQQSQQMGAAFEGSSQRPGGVGALPAQQEQQEQQEQGALAITALGATGALVEAAACLPNILPNLLINKRDELVPVLIALCQEHPDAAWRRTLAGLLFTLIKRPNASQRTMIVAACIALAKRIGAPRVMLDLLPHCKTDIRHELVERRLLVAEAAGALAQYLPPAQAAAAVLHLLEALLQDPMPQVRCHALTSLAQLLAVLEEKNDNSSFGEVLSLVLLSAADDSSDVIQRLLVVAVPAMLSWVGNSELLVAHLLPQTLAELQGLLDRCPTMSGVVEALMNDDTTQLRSVPASVQSHATTLLQIYITALPVLRSYALHTQPAWVAAAAQAVAGRSDAHLSQAAAAPSSSITLNGPASQDSADEPSRSVDISGQHTISSTATAAGGCEPFHAMLKQQQQGEEGCPSTLIPGPNPILVADAACTPQLARSSSGASTQPANSSSPGLLREWNGCPAAQQQQLAAMATDQPAAAGAAAGHGGQRKQLEAAAFAAWVTGSSQLEEWRVLDYVAVSAVPALVRAALIVGPSQDTALLVQRFVSAMKATCLAFGEPFAAAVVTPQLQAAAGIPTWQSSTPVAADAQKQQPAEAGGSGALHMRLASAGLLVQPTTPAQRVAGLSCALPLLLAGVLPYAGSTALAACLRRLCTDGGSHSGNVWALEHPRAFMAAVRSAAEGQLVQAQLVPLMWDLVASMQPSLQMAAALLAGAAAPVLHKQQVTRQLLPLLATLGSTPDNAVCRASIAAASVAFSSLPTEHDVQEALFSTLDDVMIKAGHTAEMALFVTFAPAAAGATSKQLEWLLQRLLLMLATLHQRGSGKSPSQLMEAAVTAFVALRQIESHEFSEHSLYMHFAAALTALQREADLLEQPQRDALAAMIEDHEARRASIPEGSGAAGEAHITAPLPAHGAGISWSRLPALFADGWSDVDMDAPIASFVGPLK